MSEKCNFCDYGNTYSRNTVFSMHYSGEGIVDIYSEHNDNDEWDINYCPICGKKLEEVE